MATTWAQIYDDCFAQAGDETAMSRVVAGSHTTYTIKARSLRLTGASPATYDATYINCDAIVSTETDISVLFDTSAKMFRLETGYNITWTGNIDDTILGTVGTTAYLNWYPIGINMSYLTNVRINNMFAIPAAMYGGLKATDCIWDTQACAYNRVVYADALSNCFYHFLRVDFRRDSNPEYLVIALSGMMVLEDCTTSLTATVASVYSRYGNKTLILGGIAAPTLVTLNNGWIQKYVSITLSEGGASGGILSAYSLVSDASSMSTGDQANYLLLRESQDGTDTVYSVDAEGQQIMFSLIAPAGYKIYSYGMEGGVAMKVDAKSHTWAYHVVDDTSVKVVYRVDATLAVSLSLSTSSLAPSETVVATATVTNGVVGDAVQVYGDEESWRLSSTDGITFSSTLRGYDLGTGTQTLYASITRGKTGATSTGHTITVSAPTGSIEGRFLAEIRACLRDAATLAAYMDYDIFVARTADVPRWFSDRNRAIAILPQTDNLEWGNVAELRHRIGYTILLGKKAYADRRDSTHTEAVLDDLELARTAMLSRCWSTVDHIHFVSSDVWEGGGGHDMLYVAVLSGYGEVVT